MWNTSRKAVTSSRVTCPSALAIFAPSAITAMVKATERSGGVRRPLEDGGKTLALGERGQRVGYAAPDRHGPG
jgi:hypothetical protein